MKIKFRIWDKKHNKWLSDSDLCSISHYYNIFTDEFETWDSYYKGCLSREDCVFQQFTGLLDKSGKEIYEGDIINELYQGKSYLPWGFVKKQEVKWDYNGWNIGHRGITIGCYGYEIIGNIFEQKT